MAIKKITITIDEHMVNTIDERAKESDMLLYANVKGYLMQLNRDVPDIFESEEVFVPEKKLKGVALAEE